MHTSSCRQSPRLSVFQSNYATIRTRISNSVQHELVHEAYAKGLVSKEVHRTVSSASNRLTLDERTDIFMDELESKIISDPAAMEQFVEMLKGSDASYYNDIIRNISMLHACRLSSQNAICIRVILELLHYVIANMHCV